MSDAASSTSTLRPGTARPPATPQSTTNQATAQTTRNTTAAHATARRDLPPHIDAHANIVPLTTQAMTHAMNIMSIREAGSASSGSSQPSHYSTAVSTFNQSNYQTANSSNRNSSGPGSSGYTMTIELASVNGSIRTQSGSISGFSEGTSFSAYQAQAPPGRMAPLQIHTIIDMATYHRAATRQQLTNILVGLRAPLPAHARANLYQNFDDLVVKWLDRFAALWREDSGSEVLVHRRGSARNPYMRVWSDRIQNGITPFETNVHFIFPFPPLPHPDWEDNSPTMLKMRAAGSVKLFATGQFSYVHLHAHAHPTGTRPLPRDRELPPGHGRWPGDTGGFCDELERQALEIIVGRMRQDRYYAPVFFGEYARNFFETYHDSGAFKRALGYEYVLEDVTWKIGKNPDRSFDAKIFMPRPSGQEGVPQIKARVIAAFPNNPAFLAHEINDLNDVIGKGLRLDACLEIMRSCFNISATMDEKETFARSVQNALQERSLLAPYTRNLLHG